MPRIRSIHPEICSDEVLATCSASAERTFVRLWTYLDDEGRGRGDPRLLKAALYPLDERMTTEAVVADLEELEGLGLIMRYVTGGREYIAVKAPAWARWQKPQHPSPSKLPAPSRVHSRKPHEDSGGVLPVVGVGVGVVLTRATDNRVDNLEADFAECWEHYPRKVARKAALMAYQARRRAGVPQEDLLSATKHFAQAMRQERRSAQHIMQGSTFFGPHDRWADFSAPKSEYDAPPEMYA